MSDSTFGFIGLGLIGGSIARGLRRANKDITIMAYMRTRSKLEQAKKEGTIDIILDGIDETLSACDVIFLCTPVEYNAMYLEKVRPFLKPGALITDIGSTKSDIHHAVEHLGYEDVFVGGHPMAGSEKTGYESSTDHLLENAYYIITPTKKTTPEQIERIRRIALAIGALPLVLDYHEHDFSVAAISHLPHLVASSLVNLVHDNDSSDEIMKRLAAGGFKDITRIAASSPVMWEQICMTNTENILILLKRYIASLESICTVLETATRSTGCLRSQVHTAQPFPTAGRDRSSGITPSVWIFSTSRDPSPFSPRSLPQRGSASKISASITAVKKARVR